jgi:hypothetical protein
VPRYRQVRSPAVIQRPLTRHPTAPGRWVRATAPGRRMRSAIPR